MTYNVYVVRVRDTKDPVGIFVAARLSDLREMVDDEVCDPCECEYIHGLPGGVMWPRRTSHAIPLSIGSIDDPAADELVGTAELSGGFMDNLWRGPNEGYKWRRLGK